MQLTVLLSCKPCIHTMAKKGEVAAVLLSLQDGHKRAPPAELLSLCMSVPYSTTPAGPCRPGSEQGQVSCGGHGRQRGDQQQAVLPVSAALVPQALLTATSAFIKQLACC